MTGHEFSHLLVVEDGVNTLRFLHKLAERRNEVTLQVLQHTLVTQAKSRESMLMEIKLSLTSGT